MLIDIHGSRNNLQGIIGIDGISMLAPEVVTVTVKAVGAALVNATLAGALQVAPTGAPLQAKVNLPVNPLPGIACRLNCAG